MNLPESSQIPPTLRCDTVWFIRVWRRNSKGIGHGTQICYHLESELACVFLPLGYFLEKCQHSREADKVVIIIPFRVQQLRLLP
jgi:hypothetical protein